MKHTIRRLNLVHHLNKMCVSSLRTKLEASAGTFVLVAHPSSKRTKPTWKFFRNRLRDLKKKLQKSIRP
jgi:uracil-DNA glycosylase